MRAMIENNEICTSMKNSPTVLQVQAAFVFCKAFVKVKLEKNSMGYCQHGERVYSK